MAHDAETFEIVDYLSTAQQKYRLLAPEPPRHFQHAQCS
jgi:hypothetical protein